MSDITNKSLTEIVSLIKKKEIKSEELTNAYIGNIKKGKKLNAFITESFDKPSILFSSKDILASLAVCLILSLSMDICNLC